MRLDVVIWKADAAAPAPPPNSSSATSSRSVILLAFEAQAVKLMLEQRVSEELGIDLGGAYDWIVETGEIIVRQPR